MILAANRCRKRAESTGFRVKGVSKAKIRLAENLAESVPDAVSKRLVESPIPQEPSTLCFHFVSRACPQFLSYRKPIFQKSLISLENRAVQYPGTKIESARLKTPGFRIVRLAARKPVVFRACLTSGMTQGFN